MKMLFSPGQIVMTRTVMGLIEEEGIRKAEVFHLLDRHLSGDFGEIKKGHQDYKANMSCISDGIGRVLSSYIFTNGSKVWILTDFCDDPEFHVTTILLPSDY